MTTAQAPAPVEPAVSAKRSTDVTRRFGIAVAVVLGGLIAINLLAGGVDHAVGGREPSGVDGSSYGTHDAGLAAFTSLLARFGHPVTRARGALAGSTLDPTSTVFVVEPQTLTTGDTATLLDFVSAGGRLVIGGPEPFYLRNLRDRPPKWSAGGARTYRDIDPRLGRVRVVEAAGVGSWTDPGSGVAIARDGGAILLTADRVGHGEILFLADTSPLDNAYLARADDAAFALGLAGDAPRRVTFVEGIHGYGERRGLGAIPTPWKVCLLVLAAAALALAWARSRRFGPPDRPARDFPPARAEYVRALAVTLERTRDPQHALGPLQQWARAEVARTAHLRPDASPEEIDRAAIKLGYSEAERASIRHPATDDDAALALGRLVARLSRHDGRTT